MLRRRFTALRRAPWERAAPLVLIGVAILTAGLVVAGAGGWRPVFTDHRVAYTTYGGNPSLVQQLFGERSAFQLLTGGAGWIVELCAVVIACAARGRRWLALVALLALAAVLALWVQQDPNHLGSVEAILRQVPSGSDADGQIEVGITIYAVVGSLVGVAIVTAGLWAFTGDRALRHDPAGRPARPSRGVAIGTTLLAVLVTLPLPRLALWLRNLIRPSLPPGTFVFGDQMVFLLVAAIVVVFAAAALLPRRRPDVATAALTIGIALWIPALWLLAGVLTADPGPILVLALWLVWGMLGLVGSTLIIGRTASQAPASG